MSHLSDNWNGRYASEEFVYGELPNEFLKEQLVKLPVGEILFPAEGEGRNAVYAARLGWTVSAYDISSEGKRKALQWAGKNGVCIDYQVGELRNLHYGKSRFDAIALIYAHFAEEQRPSIHEALDGHLRTGGIIILEAFGKDHIRYQEANPDVGGPRDIHLLYSTDEIERDFSQYEIIELRETEIRLSEGLYHNGVASVIRFVGRKK